MGSKVPIFGTSQNPAPPCLLFSVFFELLCVLWRTIGLVELQISGKTDPSTIPGASQKGNIADNADMIDFFLAAREQEALVLRKRELTNVEMERTKEVLDQIGDLRASFEEQLAEAQDVEMGGGKGEDTEGAAGEKGEDGDGVEAERDAGLDAGALSWNIERIKLLQRKIERIRQ